MSAPIEVPRVSSQLEIAINAAYDDAARRIGPIGFDEIPEGARYLGAQSAELEVPDAGEHSAAQQAQRIMDSVGSICFGAPGVVRIHAPDGFVHEIGIDPDNPSELLRLLGQKGYKELPKKESEPEYSSMSGQLFEADSEQAAPAPQAQQPVTAAIMERPVEELPAMQELVQNVWEPEAPEFIEAVMKDPDETEPIDVPHLPAGMLDADLTPPHGLHSRDLMQRSTHVNLSPVHEDAPFNGMEQLMIMKRALKLTHHTLAQKYNLDEDDITFAWNAIFSDQAINTVVDTYTYGRHLEQPLFDSQIARVVKTALIEVMRQAPSKRVYGDTVVAVQEGRSNAKISQMLRAQEAKAVFDKLDICEPAKPAKPHLKTRLGNVRKRIANFFEANA
ncbi:MAG: hypothetical protein ABWX94_02270 [Candidatus Saccharimonadales bacterium]